jgi:hypothetical protein
LAERASSTRLPPICDNVGLPTKRAEGGLSVSKLMSQRDWAARRRSWMLSCGVLETAVRAWPAVLWRWWPASVEKGRRQNLQAAGIWSAIRSPLRPAAEPKDSDQKKASRCVASPFLYPYSAPPRLRSYSSFFPHNVRHDVHCLSPFRGQARPDCPACRRRPRRLRRRQVLILAAVYQNV